MVSYSKGLGMGCDMRLNSEECMRYEWWGIGVRDEGACGVMPPTPVFIHISSFITFTDDLYGLILSKPKFTYPPHQAVDRAWPKDMVHEPHFF